MAEPDRMPKLVQHYGFHVEAAREFPVRPGLVCIEINVGLYEERAVKKVLEIVICGQITRIRIGLFVDEASSILKGNLAVGVSCGIKAEPSTLWKNLVPCPHRLSEMILGFLLKDHRWPIPNLASHFVAIEGVREGS